jgi:hypothetical protein
MAKKNQPSVAVVKKIQALAKLATDLHHGQQFNITRNLLVQGDAEFPPTDGKLYAAVGSAGALGDVLLFSYACITLGVSKHVRRRSINETSREPIYRFCR